MDPDADTASTQRLRANLTVPLGGAIATFRMPQANIVTAAVLLQGLHVPADSPLAPVLNQISAYVTGAAHQIDQGVDPLCPSASERSQQKSTNNTASDSRIPEWIPLGRDVWEYLRLCDLRDNINASRVKRSRWDDRPANNLGLRPLNP
jgi:hypothetical protein